MSNLFRLAFNFADKGQAESLRPVHGCPPRAIGWLATLNELSFIEIL